MNKKLIESEILPESSKYLRKYLHRKKGPLSCSILHSYEEKKLTQGNGYLITNQEPGQFISKQINQIKSWNESNVTAILLNCCSYFKSVTGVYFFIYFYFLVR